MEKAADRKRNYGIDLLRILSMLYVIILHCLGQGGVLKNAVPGTAQYKVAWFLEIWAYCAVNIFAIVSGYVGYSGEAKKLKLASYITIWLQVVFYGVVTTVLFRVWNPELVTRHDLVSMFFPVSNGLYWYFTAYTALFFVMPLLNAAVREYGSGTSVLLIAILYAGYDTVFQRFGMAGGYSFIWLLILYLLGAALKKWNIGAGMRPAAAIGGIVCLIAVSWLWKIYGVPFQLLGVTVDNSLFVSYTSPTIVGTGILYVVWGSRVKLPPAAEKLIAFLAPGAFAAYLLNNQRFIWRHVMSERFAALAAAPVGALAGEVLLFSASFVVLAILIDKVRMRLFRLFRINDAVQAVSERIGRMALKL